MFENSKSVIPVPFGQEVIFKSIRLDKTLGSIRIEAGGRGGSVSTEIDPTCPSEVQIRIVSDEDLLAIEGGSQEVGITRVYQTDEGILWFTSEIVPHHEFGTPVKLDDLVEGTFHWSQFENGQTPTEEWDTYALLRRLNANPDTKAILLENAPVRNPGIDRQDQPTGDNPFYNPMAYDQE